MKVANNLLWVNALLFLAFGLGFMFAPAFFSQTITGASPATSSAMIDMRATYGGIAIGLAIFWGWCARGNNTQLAGLLSSLLVLAATAFGRILGILMDGAPNIFMFILLAAELLFVGLIVFALKQIEKE